MLGHFWDKSDKIEKIKEEHITGENKRTWQTHVKIKRKIICAYTSLYSSSKYIDVQIVSLSHSHLNIIICI